MLQEIDVGTQPLEAYQDVIGRAAVDELRTLAEPLRGMRVAHINGTPYGGGVSEILRSLVPLMQSLEIDTQWLVIPADEAYFGVTKRIHNALQGAEQGLSKSDRDTYLQTNDHNAQLIERTFDCVIIHDPQPLALKAFRSGNSSRWVWRCHIDTSEPNPEVWEFLAPFVDQHDEIIFTMPQFTPPGLGGRVRIFPPAIDPLSPKNRPLPEDLCSQLVNWFGVREDQPLILQVARFDPWKDPLGVIDVYRLVRSEMPDVQLALLASMALDDPEAWDLYHQVTEASGNDPNIHIATNLTGISNLEVNSFQRRADIVIQKSIREGFGLAVSEALWKATPVVAGHAGGIPTQIPYGFEKNLIESTEECAERVLALLRSPKEAQEYGKAGQEHVGERFLITRLLKDYITLLRDLR